jgi:peptidoglycan/LPS O-acetylase OafA/YrhL
LRSGDEGAGAGAGEVTGPSLGALFEERSNNFNLIRLLAALAVIYGHASAITGHGPPDLFLRIVGYKFLGGVAVDVFFVISGFLIASSAMGRNGLLYYSASRVLRIYPALVCCIVVTVLVIGPLLTEADDYFSSRTTWNYLWRNMTAWDTQYFLPGVFEHNHDKAVNGSLWSLVVEVRLYVIVLAFALSGIFSNRWIFNAVFVLVLLLNLAAPSLWETFFQYENHRHVALMFLIGSFCWVNRDAIPCNGFLLLLLLAFAAKLHGGDHFGIAYALVLPYLVLWFAFVPGLAWFNKFGDYSYGVYLYGWLSQQLVASRLQGLENWENTLLSCLLALALASASWHLVERPALGLKKGLRRR